MIVRKVGNKFKIWTNKDWTFLCQLVNGEWEDLEFDTKEATEKEIERIKDHETTIKTQDWEWYSKKWNIEMI